MADEEEIEGEGGEDKKEKSSGGMLQMIILVLLIIVLGLGGFIAWKLVTLPSSVTSGEPAAGTADGKSKAELPDDSPGIFMDLDDVTVNLADVEEGRFLRVKIKLEVEGAKAQADVEKSAVEVKDMVITILSSKTFADVRTPQGKFALKEEIAYRINRLLGGHPVRDVYFSNFVAQ